MGHGDFFLGSTHPFIVEKVRYGKEGSNMVCSWIWPHSLQRSLSKFMVIGISVLDPVGSASFWRIGILLPGPADPDPDPCPFQPNIKLNIFFPILSKILKIMAPMPMTTKNTVQLCKPSQL